MPRLSNRRARAFERDTCAFGYHRATQLKLLISVDAAGTVTLSRPVCSTLAHVELMLEARCMHSEHRHACGKYSVVVWPCDRRALHQVGSQTARCSAAHEAAESGCRGFGNAGCLSCTKHGDRRFVPCGTSTRVRYGLSLTVATFLMLIALLWFETPLRTASTVLVQSTQHSITN